MKWLELKLSGVCQHNRTFTFGPGVNGILGPMGSGKTNLVNAMCFLATGNWPGEGVNEEQIGWGGKEAVVSGVLDVNGQIVTVSRSLHTSSCSLKVGKEKMVRKAADVNKIMSEFVGVSSKVLSNYCFIHQDHTNDALFDKPAERAKMFNILFGTDDCESRRLLLNQELQTYVPVTLSGEQETLPQKIAAMEVEIDELIAKRQQFQPIDLDALRFQLLNARSNHKNFNDPSTGHDATTAQIKQLEQDVSQAQKAAQETQQLLAEVDAAISQLQQEAASAKSLLERKAAADRIENQRQSLMRQLDDLTAELGRSPEPMIEPDNDEVMLQARAVIEAQDREVRRLKDFIAGFSQGKCPTCHTVAIVQQNGELMDIRAEIDSRRRTLETLEPKAQQDRQEIDSYFNRRQTTTSNHQRWVVWFQGIEQRLEQTIQILEGLPAAVTVEVADAEVTLQELRKLETSRQVLNEEMQLLNHRQAQMQARHGTAVERLRLLKQVELIDYAPLEAQVAQAEAQVTQMNHMDGQLSVLRKTLDDCRKQQQSLALLSERSALIQQYRALCNQAAGVLHRDNFPAAVARTYFQQLNEGWNRMLDTLDVNFTVQILPDTSVKVRFPSSDMRIEKLSGGQKCCASFSFLLEVNRRFAPGAGFIVLDEPTYGLDARHVSSLLELLRQINTYASNTGLQVFLVTHEERLEAGFSHVIRI